MNTQKNNFHLAGLVAFCLALPVTSIAADVNATLISGFQSFCSTQSPDFEAFDKKAETLGYTVKNVDAPKDNMAKHSKTWTVKTDDVTYDLSVAEAFGGGGHSIFCGIAQADANSAIFKDALVSQLKLGAPSSQKISPNGMRLTTWGYQGDASMLMYTDAPSSPKGFIVNFLYTLPTKN